jgi:hypothetical protein
MDTPDAAVALILASRLDSQTADTGSAMASVARELRASLAAALSGATSGDQVDEIAKKRDEKLKKLGATRG